MKISLHNLTFLLPFYYIIHRNILFFRGFGFVTFGDPSSVEKVLAHGTHELDGKKVNIYEYYIIFDFFLNFYIYYIETSKKYL